jgi:hypothetical protein
MSLAFCTEGFPYVITVNFVWFQDSLWFHCASEGRKLDCIRRDPRIAFTMYSSMAIIPERSTTLYASICGEGIAEIVNDAAVKHEALAALAKKYHAACMNPTPEAMLNKTAVVRIRIQSMNGKHNA